MGSSCGQKRRFFLIGALSILLASAFSCIRSWLHYSQLSGATDRFYAEMRAHHQRVNANLPEDAVLFLGDSHVQGLAVTAVASRGVNFGIGHDDVVSLNSRIGELSSIRHARAVVLIVGTNNVLRRTPIYTAVEHFGTTLDSVPQSVPVVVCSIFPLAHHLTESEILLRNRKEINQALERLCEETSNLHYVDCDVWLADDQGYLQAEFGENDGVHLSRLGYAALIKHLQPSLASIVSNVSNASQ